MLNLKEKCDTSRLEQVQNELGIHDKALAKMMDIYPYYINYHKTGKGFLNTYDLIKISEILKVSISYLLGITDIKMANTKYSIDFHLCDLLEEKKLSKNNFAQLCRTSSSTILSYCKEPSFHNINTLLNFARNLNVSIDYLLGLTDIKLWEDYIDIGNQLHFTHIPKGQVVAIYNNRKKLVNYALLSNKGEFLIFPDGSTEKVDSKYFNSKTIKIVFAEEVQKKRLK